MSAVQELRALLRLRLLQMAALTGLLAAVGFIALSLKYCVRDLDIWCISRLATGSCKTPPSPHWHPFPHRRQPPVGCL